MNRAVRVVVVLVGLALLVWLLFTVVFPWFDETFVNDPVMQQGLPPGRAPVAPAGPVLGV